MIILDTNVLSALMLTVPDPVAVQWLDGQPAESVWTTSITVFEVRTGLELLGSSRRRQRLESSFERVLAEDLEHRELPFDTGAADSAGPVVARSQRAGRPVEIRDAQIAGIALARRATLATANVRHFTELGVRLINPWGPPDRRKR